MVAVNPLRGEASVTIGDVEIVMAATMEGIARLSSALGCRTWNDLTERLLGGELAAQRTAIELLTVSGSRNGAALKGRAAATLALNAHSMSDIPALQVALNVILNALFRPLDEEGDRETGKDPSLPH